MIIIVKQFLIFVIILQSGIYIFRLGMGKCNRFGMPRFLLRNRGKNRTSFSTRTAIDADKGSCPCWGIAWRARGVQNKINCVFESII